jgi:hypothetical protein
MKLKELKEFFATLPVEFDEYTVVNGEYGVLNDQNYYRVDKPVATVMVDESTSEILLLHDLEDELTVEDIQNGKV